MVAKEQSEKEHHLRDIAGIHKTLINLQKVDGKLAKKQKNDLELKREKMQEKAENAALRIQEIKGIQKEKIYNLRERQKQRRNLIDEVKSAFEEEVNQKKEIQLLKKRDQQENLQRGKTFEYLYKRKLVERILEKQERAERVKDQQRKISSMCATQRVRTKSLALENAGAAVVSTSINATKR